MAVPPDASRPNEEGSRPYRGRRSDFPVVAVVVALVIVGLAVIAVIGLLVAYWLSRVMTF